MTKPLLIFCTVVVGCAHSDSYWSTDQNKDPISYAKNLSNNTGSNKIKNNLEEANIQAISLIEDHNYKLKNNKNCPKPLYRAYTSSLNNTVYLCGRFFVYDYVNQTSVLWHELIHIRQKRHLMFNPNLHSKEWDWAYEVQAYRQNLIIIDKFTKKVDKEDIKFYCKVIQNSSKIDKSYTKKCEEIYSKFFLK